jgi:hypothetical protein
MKEGNILRCSISALSRCKDLDIERIQIRVPSLVPADLESRTPNPDLERPLIVSLDQIGIYRSNSNLVLDTEYNVLRCTQDS